MTNEEYVKKYCKKCRNRNGFDKCEIKTRLDGQPNCLNYEKETLGKRIKDYFVEEGSNDIFWR